MLAALSVSAADTLAERLTALRRRLHQTPELGFAEHETSAAVRAWLAEHGIESGPAIAGTGFTAEIAGARPGPTVAYRADMDALPIVEATGAPYASRRPGAMHACGHDAHMAVACGVALLAHERRDTMAGTLRLLFQPCEERTPSGAPEMIAAGALDDVEAIYGIHVEPTLPVGQFGLREGALTAACAPFLITVESERNGHSARPHDSVDTVWIATQIASALYSLPGRVSDARQTTVLTLCRFQAGLALNVIPAHVELGGTLRGIHHATLAGVQTAIAETAEAIGALHGAHVTVAFEPTLPAVVNTPREVRRVDASARRLFGDGAPVRLPLPSMGGEDFAYYLERVPGALVRVGTASSDATRRPLHDARFDLDERALGLAARLMADVCLSHVSGEASNGSSR